MADAVEIKVDVRQAVTKLDRITPAVRDRLRKVLPDITKRLGSAVNTRLNTQLKSRRTLNVAQELHENADEIYGTVRVESSSAGGLLPTYLELGTRPHEIVGNPVLAFPWDFMGGYGGSVSANTTIAFFRRVKHPGTRAYGFTSGVFAEQQADIVQALREAISAASRGVR